MSLLNLPLKCKTISGLSVVIYHATASKDYPFLGMYKTNDEWYPHRWTKTGRFKHDLTTGLDLILVTRLE